MKYKSTGRVVSFQESLKNDMLLKYKSSGKKLCSHIQQVVKDVNCVIPVRNVKKKCVLMEIDNCKYVSVPPNILEHS